MANTNHSDKMDKLALALEKQVQKQSQIKVLIALGKEKGYLTYAEVADHLPEIVDTEQIEDIISMIQAMGIKVHGLDHADDRSEEHTSELQSLMRISYAVFFLYKYYFFFLFFFLFFFFFSFL